LTIEGKPGEVTLDAFVGVLRRSQLILAGLDSAISAQPRGSLEWVIRDLEISSAVAVVESRPKVPEADERHAVVVGANFVTGLQTIDTGETLPPYFSELDLGRVRQIAGLVKKTGSEHFKAAEENGSQRSATVSAETAAKVTHLLRPRYKTIGSVTGKLEVISIHGPAQFNVYEDRTKRAVRCRFEKERLEEVVRFMDRRVTVTGIVHRNANGDPLRVERPEIRELEDSELPTTRDLVGLVPELTGELSAEEHVRRLRNG